jgi:hypothetical protein
MLPSVFLSIILSFSLQYCKVETLEIFDGTVSPGKCIYRDIGCLAGRFRSTGPFRRLSFREHIFYVTDGVKKITKNPVPIKEQGFYVDTNFVVLFTYNSGVN